MFIVRTFIYIFFLHFLFRILFPFTGLGLIVYLPLSILIWALLSIGIFFIFKFFKRKTPVFIEIIFVIILILTLGLTFVQDSMVSPFMQLKKGKYPSKESIKKGIEWTFGVK